MSSVPSCRQRKPRNRGISWIRALSRSWIVPDSSTGYTSRNGFSRGPERLVSQKFFYPLVYLFRLAHSLLYQSLARQNDLNGTAAQLRSFVLIHELIERGRIGEIWITFASSLNDVPIESLFVPAIKRLSAG